MMKTHTCNGIEGITGKVVEFRGMQKWYKIQTERPVMIMTHKIIYQYYFFSLLLNVHRQIEEKRFVYMNVQRVQLLNSYFNFYHVFNIPKSHIPS